MEGLSLNFQGETRVFRPDGTVAATVNGQPVSKGTWRSQALAGEQKDNHIHYDFDGAPQAPVPVRYRFNQNNQLEATIPAAANSGTDSAPYAFLGSIEIDDAHDIVYNLSAADGQPLPRNVIIYGDLRFDQNTNNLVIDLAGGGMAEVKGASGLTSLEAAKNNLPGFTSNDLLRFRAFTQNKLSSGQTKLSPAKITFVGNWDIKKDQLVFVSKVKGNIAKPDVVIGFAGKIKAVSAGLVYFADKDGTKLAFNINGQHTWNGGAAKWELSLGYSAKKFTANFEGSIKKHFEDGRDLTIAGKFSLEHSDGSTANIDAELNASYTWSKNNNLIIQAKVSGTLTSLNYDLNVEGKFVFKSGTLTFQMKYSNQEPGNSFSFQIAFQGNQSSLIKALSIVLDVKENQVNIDFEFELRMSWVDGKRVKEAPQPV
jgi:hypothetical protein